MNFAVDGVPAGFALVIGDKVPNRPIDDLIGREAEQFALGTIHPPHQSPPVDFVICDGSFFE